MVYSMSMRLPFHTATGSTQLATSGTLRTGQPLRRAGVPAARLVTATAVSSLFFACGGGPPPVGDPVFVGHVPSTCVVDPPHYFVVGRYPGYCDGGIVYALCEADNSTPPVYNAWACTNPTVSGWVVATGSDAGVGDADR